MKFTNKQTVSPKIGKDGFLRTSVNLGRVGHMEYLGSELGNDVAQRPNAVYQVHTNADQLFHPDTIKSFEGVPVTDEHPDSMEVNAGNWKSVTVGHIQNVRRDGDHLVGDIVVNDQGAIDKIQNGKREVSLGYDADLSLNSGIISKINIVGNHLALVSAGRCGDSCKINDHSPKKRGRIMSLFGRNKTAKAKKFADAKNQLAKLKKKFGDTNEAFATALTQAQETIASDTATDEEKAQALADIQAQAEQLQADAEEAIKQAQDLAQQAEQVPAPSPVPTNDDDPAPTDDEKDAQIAELQDENAQLKERIAELEAQVEEQNESDEKSSVVNDSKSVFPNLKFGDKDTSTDMKRRVLIETGTPRATAMKMQDCALNSAYSAVISAVRAKSVNKNNVGKKLIDNAGAKSTLTANQRLGGK